MPDGDDIGARAGRTRGVWTAFAATALLAGVVFLAADRAAGAGWVLIVFGAGLLSVLLTHTNER